MEVFEAIKGRRSVRSFLDKEIEDEKLERILEAGIWAPSGGNVQPWEFVLIRDPRRIEKIKMVSPGMLGSPKAVIAICRNLERAKLLGDLGEEISKLDCAMAAQNMMLEAYELGIGSCVIASFDEIALSKILEISEGVKPLLLISLGYPREWPKPPKRRPLSEVVHRERY